MRQSGSRRSRGIAGCAPRLIASCSVITFGLTGFASAGAPVPTPAWVGLRTGFSATHLEEMFYQTEALAAWRLPWSMGQRTGWSLESGMEFSAGWLTTGIEHGAVGTIGVALQLGHGDLPLRLTGGTGMTLLSRYRFERESFGMPLQFTSHVGLAWDMNQRFRLGYRFQHMSNARLAQPNPGLDLHSFTLSYSF